MSTLTRREWLVAAPAVAACGFARSAPPAADVKAVVEKAVAFLGTKQNEDGSLAPKLGGPGITALTVAGLLRHNFTSESPVVTKGLAYLEKNIQKDGGVYQKGLANYTTCLAIVTFKEANTGGKYTKIIADAGKFVQGLQDSSDPKDVKHGGVGYDGKGRPDLSNTQFMVEALLAAGVSKDDPSIKKAMAFVSRSQNLPGEYNDQPFAAKATEDDKGGFVYNPTNPDDPKNDKRTAAGGLRSEGGMTYAGLKSFLYAGVGKDDKRVQAALAWIKKHYTLSENPGNGQAGLYYYYHTFAKAMDALGEEMFEDAKGVKHDWRQELFDALKTAQKDDGRWENANTAFLENQPELATAFAVLALSYCTQK
ncbi:MAG TPA: prenyltransferase/squalene oxidase repeat-containing protein [Gemmataceae bacterium]|nr:prenyltransferase/squalene oxidase repeat-containing protein [Gemmataceae bacterium]